MAGLHLDHFIRAGSDFESAQYRILGQLQDVRRAFSNNTIYPYLGNIIALYGDLQKIVESADGLQGASPREIQSLDLATGRILRAPVGEAWSDLAFVEDLIRWALPHVQAAIEEGRAIFEFVEDHLRVEEVGLVPSYLEEGYLLLPDRAAGVLHILQYHLSIFTRADERYRSLKTQYLKSVAHGAVHVPPQRVKLDLMAEHRDLPAPATYFLATDLDFPFEETMLPVAKRKLIQYLATRGGTA